MNAFRDSGMFRQTASPFTFRVPNRQGTCFFVIEFALN